MATMIPENVQQFKTPGEERFYKYLETVAVPDEAYIAWYTPDIEDREPDFVLFNEDTGIVVFEVKDWPVDQIRKADPHHFTLGSNGGSKQHKNPLQQAREYLHQIMDRIKADGRLVSEERTHYGNPKIPIQCGVVFPNMFRDEYVEKGLDRVIGIDKAFFLDDLHPDSDICRDKSGGCFQRALLEKFPRKFPFDLSAAELDHLRQLLFPTVKIELPERKTDRNYKKRFFRLKGLDHQQEMFARKFDGGHRIITGSSGSGKTLVLVHKAAFLKKYNPAVESILFVCYNITLVDYIKRLLAEKKVPMGEGGVRVMHFFELCAELLGQQVAYEKEEAEYYELVVQEALAAAGPGKVRYDAVLVDEGQDFTDDMYRLVVSLLNPKTENLTVALDDNQNIYARHSTWKAVGINARGRIHHLSHSYRNTRQIAAFAERFIAGSGTADKPPADKQKELFPDFFDFSGPQPEVVPFATVDEVVAHVGDKVIEVVEADGCPYAEIAVLYTTKDLGESAREPLPEAVQKGLESKGILSRWVSENYRSKSTYDITTDRVAVSTIHSVKGLDYACAFLLGLDRLEPGLWTREQIEKLAYVAVTRARYRLFVPYVKKTALIEKLIRAAKGST